MSHGKLLMSVRDAEVSYADKSVFSNLSFNIHNGEKLALVGRNGAGKTTLMNVIRGLHQPDKGDQWSLPALKIGYLKQTMPFEKGTNTRDFIAAALPKEQQEIEYMYLVDSIAEPLQISLNSNLEDLSGGQLRRVFLACALLGDAEILMLDEPTNHLDLAGIEWLEEYLKSYQGAVLCISHDRRFLANVTNKVFWLDRGGMRVCPYGFGRFEEWQEEMFAQEQRELHNRERALQGEADWMIYGVTARRKRNVRRVALLKEEKALLKKDLSGFKQATKRLHLSVSKDDMALPSNIIADFWRVHKSYEREGETVKLLDGFTYRILKGRRIGILGNNGSGKSTFLKLLLNETTPDKGSVKLAASTNVAYFDQNRRDLIPHKSLWATLCPEGEFVKVGGKMRHVCGYLKDFMFDPSRSRDEVSSLSGGQQNRLMLAKVLANPGNLLILDEPTNDLDSDTLEMLEDVLSRYKGTLIIVSHDREFLDRTVSEILAFEGGGNIAHHIGGYTDYIETKEAEAILKSKNDEDDTDKPQTTHTPTKISDKKQKSTDKVTFKIKHEYETLPARIDELKGIIKTLEDILVDPNLYAQNPERFDKAAMKLGQAQTALETAEYRLIELEELFPPSQNLQGTQDL
ncbi:MAG: ATP-binding cassette subfamily F protein uup [Dasania sp.]|jgi:ATP-binding cassette subfamily F protein uup